MEAGSVEAMYRQHGHVVLRRARRILGSEDDAREVLHEVFASMLEGESDFGARSSVVTWLYSVTTHACLNRLRNARTRARLVSERSAVQRSPDPASPERQAVLRDLLAHVPEELAQAAVYYYADEMTHEEIAKVLGCSRRHVGDLLTRLHGSLEALEEEA